MFLEWFRHSSEVFSKHPGFISRTILAPIKGGNRYAVIVEHESKGTFMDMHLSDDREALFQLAGACRTASHGCGNSKTASVVPEWLKSMGVGLLEDLDGHAGITSWVQDGYEIITF